MELQDDGTDDPSMGDAPIDLSAHCTSPDRTVFTEPGNPEAWIATDHTVDLTN
ncbi:hypothetical protein [Halosegnis sp.]|uniref:DUF7331 family protein n=1 Tax=Halosegnis sp. TaxID=2864959 RepID=UPI0035D501C7